MKPSAQADAVRIKVEEEAESVAKTVAEFPDLHVNMKNLNPQDQISEIEINDEVQISRLGRSVIKPQSIMESYLKDFLYAEVLMKGQRTASGNEAKFSTDIDSDSGSKSLQSDYTNEDMDSSSESDDEEIYESLIPTTVKDAKKNLKPTSFTDQQRFNQEELNTRLLLDLDPNNFSTDMDLDDTETLRKSPDFCCARRAFLWCRSPIPWGSSSHKLRCPAITSGEDQRERDGS